MNRFRVAVRCVTGLPLLVLAMGTTCNGGGGNPPILSASDTFMLTYIDSDERIRLRWSSDGFRWEDGTFPGAISDAGLGSAASDDARGATRWIAYRALNGSLRLAAGLGAFFDGSGSDHPSVSTSGAPQMTHARSTYWLVTTLGGPLNRSAVVHRFNSSGQSLTDVTPTGVPGMTNDNQLVPPSISSRGGRVVMTWMNWTFAGTNRLPGPVQVIVGNVGSDGAVTWASASNLDVTEPGFGTPRNNPVVTHDGERFLLGIVRTESGGDADRLFIYESDDGTSWALQDSLEVFVDGTTRVQIAAHAGRTMLVGLTGFEGQATLHRRHSGVWRIVADGNVFGEELPNWYTFSLIAAGRSRSPIYVDATNTDGPQNGSEAAPFASLGAAMNEAGRGDVVVVAQGTYSERITLPAGVALDGGPLGGGNVLIRTTAGLEPTISAAGDNVFRNLIIEADNQAIKVDVDAILQGLEGDLAESFVEMSGVWMRNSARGLEAELDAAQSYGNGNRRVFRIRAIGNRFSNNTGTGLLSAIQGPETGELQVSLDVRDNALESNFTGMTFRMNGNGPNTGGFIRASYAGRVLNNLIIDGNAGISLDAEDGGRVGMAIAFNTIARHSQDAIIGTASNGPNGTARVNPDVVCNVLAGSAQSGYNEFDPNTSVRTLNNNLFFGNADGHYYDQETDTRIDSVGGLNSTQTAPIAGGMGNRIGDPLFTEGVTGGFAWFNSVDFGPLSEFYLAAGSPAIDGCFGTVEQNLVGDRTTGLDQAADADPPDIGWHYMRR